MFIFDTEKNIKHSLKSWTIFISVFQGFIEAHQHILWPWLNFRLVKMNKVTKGAFTLALETEHSLHEKVVTWKLSCSLGSTSRHRTWGNIYFSACVIASLYQEYGNVVVTEEVMCTWQHQNKKSELDVVFSAHIFDDMTQMHQSLIWSREIKTRPTVWGSDPSQRAQCENHQIFACYM